jgi:hypothetical protein
MFCRFSPVFAIIALSTAAFAQVHDSQYQIGYAANLNIGDTEINFKTVAYAPGSTTTTRPALAPATSVSTFTRLIHQKKKLPAAPA